jgi:hypothetical protein
MHDDEPCHVAHPLPLVLALSPGVSASHVRASPLRRVASRGRVNTVQVLLRVPHPRGCLAFDVRDDPGRTGTSRGLVTEEQP